MLRRLAKMDNYSLYRNMKICYILHRINCIKPLQTKKDQSVLQQVFHLDFRYLCESLQGAQGNIETGKVDDALKGVTGV